MNTFNLSEEEALKVKELVEKIQLSEKPDLSVKENMVSIYMEECEGVFPEDAEEIANKIEKGVIALTDTYNEAVASEDFNFVSGLEEMGKDFSLEDKYNCYLNSLAAIRALDYNNVVSNQNVVEGFDEIKKQAYSVEGEVTQEMLDKVIADIDEALKNSTLCLSGKQSLMKLIEQLPEGEEGVRTFVEESYDDLKFKQYSALATYIAYKQGNVTSIPENTDAEVIAMGVAAGIEQEKICEDVKAGRKAWDVAVNCLKILGGVVLFCLMGWVMINVALGIVFGVITGVLSLLGGGLTAVIIASIAGMFVAYKLSPALFDEIVEPCMEKVGELYDKLTNFIKDKAYPWIVEKTKAFCNFIREKLGRGQVQEHSVTEDPEGQLVVANA